MKEMWKLEWKQWRGQFALLLLSPSIIIWIIFLLYRFFKSSMFAMVDLLFHLPETVLAFLGIQASAETGNFLFFLSFAVIPLQFWFAWKACEITYRMMHEDSARGRIYGICNQKYGRTELAAIRYRCILRLFFMPYLLWRLCLLLAGILGSFNRVQQERAMQSWFGSTIISAAVYVLFISICYVLAICGGKQGEESKAVNWILFSALCIANLYKLFDLLKELMVFLNQDASKAEGLANGLEILHTLSPLSWLNPFWEAGFMALLIRTILCLILSAALVAAGILVYRRKSLIKKI